MVRIDGQLFDIPPAVRGFQRHTSEVRANMQASHRLGFRQRHSIGDVYWTHPLVPGLAFPTKTRAIRAAIATLGNATHDLPPSRLTPND